ncbi:MAG: hypothetical protein LJE67_04620 [Salaquimonas sp.]|jgi:hypothetical protein|nr:hypothetical protein [Salaquimonas sp.]
MSELLSSAVFQRIGELPWYASYPGLAVTALLLISAIRALITLKLVKALTRVVLAAAVLIILSQAGAAISQLIGGPST